MQIRLLTILIILLPAFQGLGDLMVPVQADSSQSCCEIVETQTCCGLVTLTEVCTRFSGKCLCMDDPSDRPIPSPAPLLPMTLTSLILEIPESEELIDYSLTVDPRPSITASIEQAYSLPTHNQAQALLGIWRI